LKNGRKEVKLEALHLPNGKADTGVKGITAVLDEYNLWKVKDDCCRPYECEHWKKEWDCHSVKKTVCCLLKRNWKNHNSLVVNIILWTESFA